MSEDRLDQALNEMRNETVPADQLAAARERVWERLSGADSALCAGFRASFEEYSAGRLEAARRLLLEDHLGRCVSCRRALAESEAPTKVQPMPMIHRRVLPAWSRWAIAAGVAAMALYLGRGPIDRALAPSGPRATVVSVRGNLYELPQGALQAGATLSEGEVVRTGMDSRAVLRLADGSLVEVNERTELSVGTVWSGQSIRLERGDVIVQAAKQRRGHLRVVTRDSVASVKGTVFAVSTGLAGSLVSVVEGSVQVSQPSGARLLRRGERAASTAAMGGVSVRRSVAWSQDAEKYYALLGELANIEKAVAATATPAPRTEARLLALLPPNPVVYVAIPNLGPTLQQAVTIIEQRAQESEVLREWWTSADIQKLKALWIGKVQTLSPMVGDEIVFVLSKSPVSPARPVPAVLAEVKPGGADGLRQALAQILPEVQPMYQVTDKLLVISDSQEHLAATLAGLGQGGASPFAAEIATHYPDGVGVLVAINAAMDHLKAPPQVANLTGVSRLQYFFFDQRASQGIDTVEASFVFDGPRTGVASWLASPGAAGSSEYASADAVFVVSASTRNPREAFDEFSSLMSQLGPMYSQGLTQFETQTGVNVANDIASAFGADFTVSVERPTIPLPGWVAAVEVLQPQLIDSAARRFVESVNAKLAAEGQPALISIAEETVDGRKWLSLRSSKSNVALNWTYDRGYLVASTDRALAAQAVATRSGGFPLVRSASFQAQLPVSVGLHQSGFVWLNTQGALADVAGLLGAGPLKTALESREPILVVVDGERERIRAASRTRLMSMLFTAMLAGGPKAIQSPPRQPDSAHVTRH